MPFMAARPRRRLPPAHSLRPLMPGALNQGRLGACVANALSNAHLYQQARQSGPPFQPSRLFIYWNARYTEGTTGVDSGCTVRDAIKSAVREGVCDERLWPYRVTRFDETPPVEAFRSAQYHQALRYSRVGQNDDLKHALVEGFPVLVGIAVYESFESQEAAKTGDVPMPDPNAERMLGGHCVLLVGYDDRRKKWELQNSWGASWGDDGYFRLPYDYLLNPSLSSDFWDIRLVEVAPEGQ